MHRVPLLQFIPVYCTNLVLDIQIHSFQVFSCEQMKILEFGKEKFLIHSHPEKDLLQF